MGFNTAVVIYNDQFHEYENNPQRLINEIKEVMGRGWEEDRSSLLLGHCHHADEHSLIMVGGNRAEVMAQVGQWGSRKEDSVRVAVLKAAADLLGYRLVRKSKKK